MGMPPTVVRPQVRTLDCPNCGGAVQLKGYAQTVNAVCIQCLSILDATNPNLRVLQQFKKKQRFQPVIPLGTRGKLQGVQWEAIGFQVRQIVVEGEAFRWTEYLLFNPYKGYRYLSEYEGHWNFIRVLPCLVERQMDGVRPTAHFGGKKFAHFQNSNPESIFVMGEFPWQVRVGDKVKLNDFVSPPLMLSVEETKDESIWSEGVYTKPEEIWAAFDLKKVHGDAPAPKGVFSNQPSPHASKPGSSWKLFALFLLLFIVTGIAIGMFTQNKSVFKRTFAFTEGVQTETSFVTPVFQLGGGSQNVEVEVNASLQNDWIFVGMALINDETGQAYDFGKELSFYSGYDDGYWTEGNTNDSVTIPDVPAGRYYLRIEPTMKDDSAAAAATGSTVQMKTRQANYTIEVKRGVPSFGFLWLAGFLLIIPPIVNTIRYFSFENTRWAESDYGGFVTSGDSDE